MYLAFLAAFKASGVGDLFTSGSSLANLGVAGLLGTAVIVLAWLHYKSDKREEERADAALQGWAAATTQFERALDLIKAGQDVIEKMQNRKRHEDSD